MHISTFAKNKVMNYLQVEGLTKYYGEICLFENISFTINEKQKIALIAKNGTGKTSLLNAIAGLDPADSGNITINKNIKTAYLQQSPVLNPEFTVLDEILHTDEPILNTVREYENAVLKKDVQKIELLAAKMDELQAWDHETRIKQILFQLKITELDKRVGKLSGGQQKRVALAKCLIEEPDFLILDEPTNHLDLDMIEWLESYFTKTNITLLMVTHDRYFLDRVCNEILELDMGNLYRYEGNYTYYLNKHAERVDLENLGANKARNLLKKELDWVNRMPKARGTKAKYRVENVDKLKEKASSKRQEGSIDINVKASRMGKKILEIEHLSKSFDGKTKIVDDFSYTFNRYERIGIVGENGSGKTTFLNLITGNLKPDGGRIEVGETIVYGYYKQEGLNFNENTRVIDTVQDIAQVVKLGDGNILTVSQFLNHFLFPPETHNLRIAQLSGGEQRRLYLLTVLMKNPNFLILDEPTNDLDILTLNVLEEYLKEFQGCLIIVSHDRYFMDKLVDHMFVFQGKGQIKDFPGNYTQFRDYKLSLDKEIAKSEKAAKPDKKEKKAPPPARKKLSFKEKKELEMLEAEIEKLEKEKGEIEDLLNSGTLSPDELLEKSNYFSELMNRIDEKSTRWLELSELE